jgi:hypothetical protein
MTPTSSKNLGQWPLLPNNQLGRARSRGCMSLLAFLMTVVIHSGLRHGILCTTSIHATQHGSMEGLAYCPTHLN